MTIRGFFATVLLLAPVLAYGQQPLPIGKLSIVQSMSLGEIDIDRMKGQPAKLAWSPNGKELYLQLLDGQFGKGGTARHVVFALAGGKQKKVDAEPAWANAYWARKSGQASPDEPAFKISVVSAPRVERTTSAPMGGDLARGATSTGGDIGGGAGGTTAGEAIANAAAMQTVMVHAMKLAGETIGEFVNSVIVPGLTFGWGPAGSKAIVFAEPKGGKLVIMDSARRKQDVDGTKDALLPAFSDDGTKLAWLQRDGRKKFSLLIADVSAR